MENELNTKNMSNGQSKPKNNTKALKNEKRKTLLFKIIKLLLMAYIVVFVIWFIIANYTKDDRSIYEKIGSLYPYSISIKDALNIKGYGLMTYRDYILDGDFMSAYDMLTEEYKNYMPYDEYVKTLDGIDFETFDMKEIKMKAEGTYVATVVYEKNGEEKEIRYLLYLNKLNPKVITISPDEFIYTFKNLRAKQDNVELTISECNVFIDKIELKAVVKNTSMFDTMDFSSISVGYNENMNKIYSEEYSLAPKEEKYIDTIYTTDYFIPDNVKITRNLNDEKQRTYTFYFDKAKEI